MEEQWKDVPFAPNRQVSNLGRARSKALDLHNGKTNPDWKPLAMTKRFGYTIFQWGDSEGRAHGTGVHRIVAVLFIPNPENKPDVNHKNGQKSDNRVENLEWCTESENMTHSCRVLGNNVGEKVHLSKLSNNDVLDIRAMHTFGASRKDIEKSYGVHQSTISRILSGAKWKSV